MRYFMSYCFTRSRCPDGPDGVTHFGCCVVEEHPVAAIGRWQKHYDTESNEGRTFVLLFWQPVGADVPEIGREI